VADIADIVRAPLARRGAAPTGQILSFHCPDRLGVVARFSQLLYQAGAFITEMSEFSNPVTGSFHARCVFADEAMSIPFADFASGLDVLARKLDMTYSLRPVADRPRILIAVSRFDHCLHAMLAKWRAGTMPADIIGVVSNHEDCRALAEWYGLPYWYLPITAATKPQQERRLLEIMANRDAELLVLARYMQVLSDELCTRLDGRVINIHYSFLPAFKGAKPYHQACERGVKVIGATAHYVTPDLDEGPIITQEVRPIDHDVTAEQMIEIGHDTEAAALTRAVRLHCENRVQLVGARTVIL